MTIETQKKQIEERLRRLKELKNYTGEDRVVLTPEMEDIVREEKERISFCISTPFKDLTKNIDGFHNGQLVTIGGLSGEGKTSFCQSLTHHIIKEGYGVLWFSYEVPEGEFLMRMPKMNEKIPVFAMPRRTKPRDMFWFEDRILEALAKYPDTKVVFIDSIGFLFNEGTVSAQNSSLSIGSIVARLKEIAILFNIVIVVTTNLVKNIREKTPTKEDIRDSGRLVDYSDIVLILWREKRKIGDVVCYTDNTYLKLEKNRWNGRYDNQVTELQYRDNLFRDFVLPVNS